MDYPHGLPKKEKLKKRNLHSSLYIFLSTLFQNFLDQTLDIVKTNSKSESFIYMI